MTARLPKSALILALPLAALPLAAGAETLRVALVLPGSITDGTFNAAANEGILAAKAKYDIEVSVRENTDFAQIAEVLTSYARDGYDVVIGHGFQFAEPVLEIHAQYPDTWFIVNTAQVAAEPNVASFDNRWGDAGYIAGAVAALVTEKGVIGHIGGIPVPVIEDYNAGFAAGATRVKPDVKVLSAYVGSFSDIARGAEITTSLIEQGADVVTSTGNENVVGTIQAAGQAGVMAIGTAFDAYEMAPDTIVTTALINMGVNIDMAIGKVVDGSIKPEVTVLGLNENGIGLAPFRGRFEAMITPEKQAVVDAVLADVRDGKAGK
ncbi:BMP family protein [Ruixingdingia sedimenti]|uniref:BMP family protein n=1 Tax=Ruixingdingia sedimenti TaxID=3073604 RepID=A0ABU1F904_9RHOB|nr:BMP family protein [Xinfangfangia sp. LG-4]MDR5653350.1 BMP family protein [Xinfangfangia sp. LG-4]